jgi:hypothetical protein
LINISLEVDFHEQLPQCSNYAANFSTLSR